MSTTEAQLRAQLRALELALEEARTCAVCLDAPKECALQPCGHACVCAACAAALLARPGGGACPLCRAVVTSVARVYL